MHVRVYKARLLDDNENRKGNDMKETLEIWKLNQGNETYRKTGSIDLRLKTARDGQHPYAVVICCSDSRVIPEQIFSATIGDLFVIRVAGNVLDKHQLGCGECAGQASAWQRGICRSPSRMQTDHHAGPYRMRCSRGSSG